MNLSLGHSRPSLVAVWRRRVCIASLCFSVLLVGTTRADETTKAWSMRGVADLPPSTLIELAKSGEPLWYQPDNVAGDTLRNILFKVCGDQPASVAELIERKTVQLNYVNDLEAFIAEDEVVAIPFCLHVKSNVPILVNSGDTPSGILKREYGVYGPKTLEAFYQLNAEKYDYKSFGDFERSLPAGKEVVIPFAAPARIFVPSSKSDKTPPQIVAALSSANLTAQVNNSLQKVNSAPDREPYQLQYVQSVQFENTAAQSNCGAVGGQAAMIVDKDALTTRFAAEMEKMREFQRSNEVRPTIVGIIDTGVMRAGDDFFSYRFFLPNIEELNGTPNIDDDRNDHTDDIYGTNYYSHSGRIEPLPTDPAKDHGTKMASLVLGGPEIASEWTLKFDPPVIRLKIINFSNSIPVSPTVSPSMLPAAFYYMREQGAQIINLSLATTAKILPINNSFRDLDDTLFVVAAGNSTGGPGRNLGGIKLYPARYGGSRGYDHVITVAAHDLIGERASFSNFSNEFVDILAPGCAVKARSDNGNIVYDNGTSPATAIVSFTSGLIHALGLTKPAQIKNRLLVGSDFDINLAQEAWSSSRLNVLKAISLYHDVVEMRNDDADLVFGSIVSPIEILQFCEDPHVMQDIRSLRKIIPNIKTQTDTKIEYWIETDEKLSRFLCNQINEGRNIGKIRIGNEVMDGPQISEIKEIIFATYVRR